MNRAQLFAAQARVARAFSPRKVSRRKRLPRTPGPRPIDRAYRRALLDLVRQIREAYAPVFAALPALIARAQSERNDSASDDARDLLARTQAALEASVQTSDLERIARRYGSEVDAFQRAQLAKQVRSALGADVFAGADGRAVQAALNGFIVENVALIKDLRQTTVSGIEQTITRAVASATPHSRVAEELEKRFGLSERRAALIARDQIGKAYGQITAARHRQIGVSRYIWRTVRERDERVREEHEEREGEVFSYDDPPEDGHPGEPINCRCYPEPVLDDVLGD